MALGWIVIVLWWAGLWVLVGRGKYAWFGALLLGIGIGAYCCLLLLAGGVHVHW